MTFRVAARTLLQLGAELISSDAVAFYELIKNGFDAGSRVVEVAFTIRIPGRDWEEVREIITAVAGQPCPGEEAVGGVRQDLVERVDREASDVEEFVGRIRHAQDICALQRLFRCANSIVIRDRGVGMSLKMLDEVYLTLGTRFRRVERQQADHDGHPRLTLGEKGVGRLSVMRLGSQLLVRTTQHGDRSWHELRIDWGRFSHDSDELLEAIQIVPSEGPMKENPDEQGTEIRIWGLPHGWRRLDVERLVREEFVRFVDPFAKQRPLMVDASYNGRPIPGASLDRLLFSGAHATMNATFEASGAVGPRVTADIDYRLAGEKKTVSLDAIRLMGIANTTISVLRSIGSFEIQLYWFNRGLLHKIEGVGDQKIIRGLLDQWGGGIAVYRDGFRVNPYGGRDDDWLSLDKDAFRSPSYKLNRQQIVAKLSISAVGNPHLVDQTNREGLQNNDQFAALRAITKHLLEDQLRAFMDAVEERRRMTGEKAVPIEVIEERTRTAEQRLNRALRLLVAAAPEAAAESGIEQSAQELITQVQDAFKQTRSKLAAFEADRERLVLLAGTGLLLEIIAHELHRATSNALVMVNDAARDSRLAPAKTVMNSLGAQLQTLRTRLSLLDDLSVSGRQTKTPFDLIAWVREIVQNHHAQFERHGITAEVRMTPVDGPATMQVKMVRGMVVQLLENLLSNSVYWLSVAKRAAADFEPRIWVTIDTQAKSVAVTDNGPGIELARVEDIFLPFHTTKPPAEGHGLGLYICREIARYHNATLRLSAEPLIHEGRLNTFVFTLGRSAE